jgi:hypothetical protein
MFRTDWDQVSDNFVNGDLEAGYLKVQVPARHSLTVFTAAKHGKRTPTPTGLLLVPSLLEGLRVVQGLRVVPAFLYPYTMQISLKKVRSPGTTEGGRSD